MNTHTHFLWVLVFCSGHQFNRGVLTLIVTLCLPHHNMVVILLFFLYTNVWLVSSIFAFLFLIFLIPVLKVPTSWYSLFPCNGFASCISDSRKWWFIFERPPDPQKFLLPTGLTCLCDVTLRFNLSTLTGSELFHARKSYLLGICPYFFLTIIILCACVHAPKTSYALTYTNILFHFFF